MYRHSCYFSKSPQGAAWHAHLSNLCMVSASVLLSSSMMRLGGWRGSGSEPYCSGWWAGGAGHLWKASEGASKPPAGTLIRSFFGGKGGDIFTDMHGSLTGAPSAGRGRVGQFMLAGTSLICLLQFKGSIIEFLSVF